MCNNVFGIKVRWGAEGGGGGETAPVLILRLNFWCIGTVVLQAHKNWLAQAHIHVFTQHDYMLYTYNYNYYKYWLEIFLLYSSII